MLDRDDLISAYAERVVDGMDVATLAMYAVDKIRDDLRTYSDEQLHNEIADFYPDLLED